MIKNTLLDPKVIEAINALPDIGSTDGMKTDRPAVKIFSTVSTAFWIVWESSPTGELFGYAELLPGYGELGYSDLGTIVDALGIYGEQDVHVSTLVAAYHSREINVPDYLVAA